MPIIDPNKNPLGVNKRLEGETNPAYRRMLEEVRFHIAVEAGGDIESAVARLAPECEYILYDIGKAPTVISGHENVRKHFYQHLFDAMDFRLEFDIVLCTVEGNVVITGGQQKNAVRGSTLIKAGFDADADTLYLQDARHLVIWPFDDQLRLIGETVYQGWMTPLSEVVKRPLKPDDIGNYSGSNYAGTHSGVTYEIVRA